MSASHVAIAQQQDVVAMYLFQGQSEETWRVQFEMRTKLQVQDAIKAAELTSEQAKQLELAVRGDFSRFYRDIEKVREETKGLTFNNVQDQQKIWAAIQPVYTRGTEGLLSDTSLFYKVLDSVLTEVQKERYKQHLKERQQRHLWAIVKMTIADVEKRLPLTVEQRQALLELVQNSDLPAQIPKAYEPYVGYAMLCRIAVSEMESPILDEHQRDTFHELLQPYRGYVQSITW